MNKISPFLWLIHASFVYDTAAQRKYIIHAAFCNCVRSMLYSFSFMGEKAMG